MTNWRPWGKLLAGFIVTLTTLVIAGLFFWAQTLNSRIEEGLRTKKFLPPTQYFSAPEWIFPGMRVSPAHLIEKLRLRQYREKTWQDTLRAGEFVVGTQAECSASMASPWPETGSSCLLIHLHDSLDPEMQPANLQMLVWNTEGEPLQAYRGNPLQAFDGLVLEPQLVAQYLDKEPIQQNYTPLGEMPVACLNAVLAIEDPQFLQHSGVSWTGIARAIFRNLTGSKYSQGGSTITQQMVKNYFLTAEHTYKRKITEFLMALILESHASKDEILETYLNIIYLGQNGPFQIRGFPAASEYYFGHKIQDLGVPECALLAAVLNSPGLYDPFHKAEAAKKRRHLVLDKMVEHGFIAANDEPNYEVTPLPVHSASNIAETAPYYIDAVQREMQELSLPILGAKIFTGLDLQAQDRAQRAVRDQLQRLESENKFIRALHEKGKTLEAVLLSAQNKTGLVQAIVGGRSYRLTQFNRAIDSHRQVGSIMKPFVFLAALESSTPDHPYSPLTILHDSKFTFEYGGHQSWSPENYGQEYMGDVPMYVALKSSLNCATASLGLAVGLDKVISVAQATGISSPLQNLPSVTLGAFELSPKEVLQSYSTLAQFGDRHAIRTLREVLNETDQIVYKSSEVHEPAVAPEPVAALVSMMKQTLVSGSAKTAKNWGFTAPAAGKTGTTSESKDAWFGGFTPFLTTVVWVGYDEPTPNTLTGASGALPVWAQFMKEQSVDYQPVDFTWPADVIHHTEPDGAELVFVKGTEPTH